MQESNGTSNVLSPKGRNLFVCFKKNKITTWYVSLVFCENRCCLLVEFVYLCIIFTLSNISEKISYIKLHLILTK